MATVSIPAGTSALLLDIEGTTTPITFVKVTLIRKDTFQQTVYVELQLKPIKGSPLRGGHAR